MPVQQDGVVGNGRSAGHGAAGTNGGAPGNGVVQGDQEAVTEHKEWTEPYNSFNSWKGLMYLDHYKGIVEERLLPPVEASIDPTYVCNIDCVWCNSWRILHKDGKVGHKMTDEHLLGLCSFLADWGVRGFCFAGGGDPTLHPALWDALLTVKERGRENSIITNGIKIDTARKQEIAVSSCRWIGISLDAGSAERYAEIKKTSPRVFHKIVDNVRAMTDLVRKTGARCEIAIKYLIHPTNSDEILKACELARDLGVAHFHARPAASENIEGLGARLHFPMDAINAQLDECLKMQTPDFKTFGVRHKFTETFNLQHGFTRCWSAPLVIQCGADGYVYNCVDWRGDPNYILGMHWPNPEQILEFWGSPKHIEFMKKVNVDKCPRCTYGIYAQQIENAVHDDGMCVNFP